MSPITTIIKRLRGLGFTQREIARRTKIQQPTLSRWEAGHTPAAVDAVLALQKLYSKVTLKGKP